MTDNRLDPVARKPIDTNPQLQVTKVFISLIKNDFKSSFQAYGKEKSKAKLRHKNLWTNPHGLVNILESKFTLTQDRLNRVLNNTLHLCLVMAHAHA